MISINKLNKTYDRHTSHRNHVLRDVTLNLPDTGFVCILGPSGCGKTSLLNAIGGLDKFDSGTLSGDGFSVNRYGTRAFEAERNRSFGYIFQNYYLLTEHSVAYNVYIGMHTLALSHKEKLIRVREALEAVDMQRYEKRLVKDLSGGQQQRVAIARALARRPRVIFADEPTGNLDEVNTMNICTLLRRISKTSLVIMVTHEEQIANFFADRIIKLDSGTVTSDVTGWQRNSLSISNGVYSGDFEDSTETVGSVKLRVLREEGADSAEISVILGRDRIVIKLDDKRAVSTVGVKDAPVIIEGEHPDVTLDEIDRLGEEDTKLTASAKRDKTVRAGKGIPCSMILSEAMKGIRQKGASSFGMVIFLLILTVLTMITVSDYITVASVDVEEFITTNSHILRFRVERGEELSPLILTLDDQVDELMSHLESSGLDFSYVPQVGDTARIKAVGFLQLGSVTAKLQNFSYVPIRYLDPETLIYGRMPERPDEIVIDRWVLEAFMKDESIVKRGLVDVSGFIGVPIDYLSFRYKPTIVGICDSGEPSLYLYDTALITLGISSTAVMSVSELQTMFPGEYDDLSLAIDECLIVTETAGASYNNHIGSVYTTKGGMSFKVVDTLKDLDIYPFLIINDDAVPAFMKSVINSNFNIYCEDKASMHEFIEKGLPDSLKGQIKVAVVDIYSDRIEEYTAASTLKADARIIITVTVIIIMMIMLYLTQRSRIGGRMDTISVYRLLGIPKRKLVSVFAIETALLSIRSSLPIALLTYFVISMLGAIPDIEFSLILPWQGAVFAYLGILTYHLLVTILPVMRLLSLPPARLAAKYDI